MIGRTIFVLIKKSKEKVKITKKRGKRAASENINFFLRTHAENQLFQTHELMICIRILQMHLRCGKPTIAAYKHARRDNFRNLLVTSTKRLINRKFRTGVSELPGDRLI